MIQLPLCHRAVLFRVRVRNEWTTYTQHDILSREKDSSTLTSKEKDQANVFATSLNPSQTGGKNKTLLWWPAIFLIFYLFIYLNSLGFGIHLFVQQASAESLQHNRCTAVNKTDMASWSFHSAGKSNSSSSNWDTLPSRKIKASLRLDRRTEEAMNLLTVKDSGTISFSHWVSKTCS